MSQETLKNEVRNVGKLGMIYMLGPAISRIIGFLLIPIYTRYISPDKYGVMSLADILMTVAMMVLSVKVGDSMTRFYYDYDDESERNKLVSSVIFGLGLIGIPLTILMVAGSGYIGKLIDVGPEYQNYLQIVFLVAWFSMLAEIGYSYLRMRYMAVLFVSVTLFQILCNVTLNIYLVVFRQLDIYGILYSTLITQGLIGIGLAATILWKLKAKPSLRHLKDLLAFGLPLVPSAITQQMSNYLSPMMIRWLYAGDPVTALAQVGLFSAGQKMGVVVNRFVVVPFNAFWKPRRMELVLKDDPEVKYILARMCTYATLATTAFALLLCVSVECIVKLVIDARYVAAHTVVPFIALGYVIHGLEHHFSTGMHYRRKTVWATWIGFAGLAVMLVSNFLFIPRFGIIAAAAATVAAVTLRSTLFYVVSQRLYRMPFEIGRIVSIIASASLLYFVSQQIETTNMVLTLALRVGCGMAFAPLLYASGFFTADEQTAILEFVKAKYNRLRRRKTNDTNTSRLIEPKEISATATRR